MIRGRGLKSKRTCHPGCRWLRESLTKTFSSKLAIEQKLIRGCIGITLRKTEAGSADILSASAHSALSHFGSKHTRSEAGYFAPRLFRAERSCRQDACAPVVSAPISSNTESRKARPRVWE